MKTNADGGIEKYKARYIVKGFKQIEGIDYSETFAPTSKLETFRIILSLAAKENYAQTNGCKVGVLASRYQGRDLS